ncbi:MAG: dienelactone hydrolase family protein [Fimbriimonadaceae bacterium]
MKHFLCIFLLAMVALAGAQVMGGPVDYKSGNTMCQGYLAIDTMKTGKRPGILIIHDWNSIDDYEMSRATQLAKMGYVAMVADIYGKGVRPANAEESGKWASKFKSNRMLFRDRLRDALETLEKDPNVDSKKIVAIGYCFGGTGVLELARMGAELKGVVSFHGGLDAASGLEAGPVIPRVLICHGADDPFVPASQVMDFKSEFKSAKMEFVSYPGAVHSFTNPTAGTDKASGAAYNKAADEASWQKLKVFLTEVFKG